MKKLYILTLALLCSAPSIAQKNKADQIKMAVQAAPVEARDGAHVYGFDDDGNFITLREGTNNFVVRADDPNKDGFEIVCYPKDVEPFMARGRALKAEGKNRGEIFAIREKEMMDGTLQKPGYGSTLQIYYGKDAKYNTETGKVEGGSFRYVIYTPLATALTTGLPEKPNGGGHPWVMFPGLYRAHIMITPPAGK
ncbi:hypothetical protein [Roseivirga sp. E12]|uniref:hypothetical protein n=1 Tax=Roseivirga sp. E12 TaxID=2819237 RepID=UPI001ABCBE1B|nr:hypothetical protein [Roseivirga sp. E12]MBO3697333.1 hypothetical protein [Roseivirga sp. E12]